MALIVSHEEVEDLCVSSEIVLVGCGMSSGETCSAVRLHPMKQNIDVSYLKM